MTKELDIEFLVQEARSIADVLATHKVFAAVDPNATQVARVEMARHIAYEKQRFVGTVVRHAVNQKALMPETLQYPSTGAWIRFNTTAPSSGRVTFLFVDAIPAFAQNPDLELDEKIDYIALANDIQFVLENNARKPETKHLGDDREATTR